MQGPSKLQQIGKLSIPFFEIMCKTITFLESDVFLFSNVQLIASNQGKGYNTIYVLVVVCVR